MPDYYYRDVEGFLEILVVRKWQRKHDGTRQLEDGRTEAELLLLGFVEESENKINERLRASAKRKDSAEFITIKEIGEEFHINRSSVHKALRRLNIQTWVVHSGKSGKPSAAVSMDDFSTLTAAYERVFTLGHTNESPLKPPSKSERKARR
jgi:Bacterial regulatory proteins, gntR family